MLTQFFCVPYIHPSSSKQQAENRHILLSHFVLRLVNILYLCLHFGGLKVACCSLIPKFAGSNPAEAVGFFRTKKSSSRLPSGIKLSLLSHVVDLRHVKDP